MLGQPASHLEALDPKNMHILLVFHYLGLDNTVLNIKPSPETVKRANNYFHCMKTNCTEGEGTHTVLNTTVYAGEGASAGQGHKAGSGDVLYLSRGDGCMGVRVCKIHWAVRLRFVHGIGF